MIAKTEGELLQEISSKLDVVIAFLAARGLEDDTATLVEKLGGLGLGAKVIAPIAGTTENAVAIRLSRLKKKSKKKSNKKSSHPPESPLALSQ